MRRFILLVVCLGSFLYFGVVRADYGERFLAIRCNPSRGLFEVEPLIIWNEDLDKLLPALKRGRGRVKLKDQELLRIDVLAPMAYSTLSSACEVSGIRLKVVASDLYSSSRTLAFYEGTTQVASVVVGWVWSFYSDEFKVRYRTKTGWEEICGRVESPKVWRPLQRARRDTNTDCSS